MRRAIPRTPEPDGTATGCNPVERGWTPTGVSLDGSIEPMSLGQRRTSRARMGSWRRVFRGWIVTKATSGSMVSSVGRAPDPESGVTGSTPVPPRRLQTCSTGRECVHTKPEGGGRPFGPPSRGVRPSSSESCDWRLPVAGRVRRQAASAGGSMAKRHVVRGYRSCERSATGGGRPWAGGLPRQARHGLREEAVRKPVGRDGSNSTPRSHRVTGGAYRRPRAFEKQPP